MYMKRFINHLFHANMPFDIPFVLVSAFLQTRLGIEMNAAMSCQASPNVIWEITLMH